MAGRELFDRIVVVDWSAASRPKRGRDSIWMATIGDGECAIENIATRRACEHRLAHLLVADRHRTLLGVDFSLGYPAGTAAALGLGGSPWCAMWDLLESAVADDDRNVNNRFAVAADLNRRLGGGPGPFWGRPRTKQSGSLTTTKAPTGGLPEWRAVERMLRAAGRRPFSSWQLLGAGSVGSQSLVGIPVLERLRRRGGDRVHVWPFSTGLAVPSLAAGGLVIAEVWPSLVDVTSAAGGSAVRDAVQVDGLARELADVDRRGQLPGLFTPAVEPAARRAVVAEEGWVLGALPGAQMTGRLAAMAAGS